MTDRQQNIVAWWTDSENATALYVVDPDGGHGFIPVCDVIGVELSALNATTPGVTRHEAQNHLFPTERSGAGQTHIR